MTAKKIKKTELSKLGEERNKRINEVIDIVLKRGGLSNKELLEVARKSFFANNIDLLTPAEKKKYSDLIL